MRFGTRVMKCDEILKVVEKVWNSKEDAVTISRGQMSHHQVIAAAYYMNGDNAYLTHKDGLDFRIRNNFCPNEDNTGALRVTEFENEDTQAKIKSNERIKKGLKYEAPSILELKLG